MLLAIHPGGRLELRLNQEQRYRPLSIDWGYLDTFSPAGISRRQPIAKAIGLGKIPGGPPMVVDATAGFGHDTWLLASLGCRVTAIERVPVIATMLRDAHRRSQLSHRPIAQRITTVCGDAKQVLMGITPRPDVVYLDPMFPRKKKASLEKQAMRDAPRDRG